VFDLRGIQEILSAGTSAPDVELAVVDRDHRLLVGAGSPMTALLHQPVDRVRAGTITQWLPADPDLPTMARWNRAVYVHEAAIVDELPWSILAVAPVATSIDTLSRAHLWNLGIALAIILVALLVSVIASRRLV